jgi:hypothetical protein
MGDQADNVLLALGPNTFSTYATIVKAFDDHFIVCHNTIYEQAKFNTRSQLEHESIEDFVIQLYTLVEHCSYATLRDKMIHDCLVVGLCNHKLSKKLQLDTDLTLEQAITTSKQWEAIKLQQAKLHMKPPQPAQVECLQKLSPPPSMQHKCPGCGGARHEQQSTCPAFKATCYNCQQTGHFASI